MVLVVVVVVGWVVASIDFDEMMSIRLERRFVSPSIVDAGLAFYLVLCLIV